MSTETELFSIYSFDYLKNELDYEGVLYKSEDEAFNNINSIILKIMKTSYNIVLDKTRLFIIKDNVPEISDIVKYNIQTDLYSEIIFVKTSRCSIDVYLKGIDKGYLYNKETTKKIYKFFIVKHTAIENNSLDKENTEEFKSSLVIKKFDKHDFQNTNEKYNSFLTELKDKIKTIKNDKTD